MTKHLVLIVFVLQAVICAEIAKGQEFKPASRKMYVDIAPSGLNRKN